jgi:hypothetical protein
MYHSNNKRFKIKDKNDKQFTELRSRIGFGLDSGTGAGNDLKTNSNPTKIITDPHYW